MKPEPDASPDHILCMAASADRSSLPAGTWTKSVSFFGLLHGLSPCLVRCRTLRGQSNEGLAGLASKEAGSIVVARENLQ